MFSCSIVFFSFPTSSKEDQDKESGDGDDDGDDEDGENRGKKDGASGPWAKNNSGASGEDTTLDSSFIVYMCNNTTK